MRQASDGGGTPIKIKIKIKEAAAEKKIRKRQRKEAAGAVLVPGYPFFNFLP